MLAPAPAGAGLAAMNLYAPTMDYPAYPGYGASMTQRQSPTPSLTLSSGTSTRDSIDSSNGSPDMNMDMMARYRAQAELLSRAGVPTNAMAMQGMGAGLMHPSLQNMQGVVPNIYDQAQQHPINPHTGTWGGSSFPSASSSDHKNPASYGPAGSAAGGGRVSFPSHPSHSSSHHHQSAADPPAHGQQHAFPSLAQNVSFPSLGQHRRSDDVNSSDGYASEAGSTRSSNSNLDSRRYTFERRDDRGLESDGKGEGGFSSAFGLMSLDDPNVLAGLANDSVPFFSSVSASAQPVGASSSTDHAESSGHGSSGDPDRNDRTVLGDFATLAVTPLSSKEELKDFWKQYMRTPLTGPGTTPGLFGPGGLITPTASGNHLQLGAPSEERPSPSRRHSRVASLPSMKTPTTFGDWNLFANSNSGANNTNMPPPVAPSSSATTHNTHHSINGLFPPVPAFHLTLNRKPKQHAHQQGQAQGQSRTMHGDEDLKSYEQAVLARKAPTLLNLVPRRRGTTISNAAASRNDSSSPPAGLSTGEHLSRPQSSTSTASSSSLADALRSSSDSESLASDPPLSSSSRPGTASSRTSDGFHHQTIDLTGDSDHHLPGHHGGDSPTPSAHPLPQMTFPTTASMVSGEATAYRPSFKRLASQTLAPDNAKRALLGPAGWDDSNDNVDDEFDFEGDLDDEGDVEDSDDELSHQQRKREERERYEHWGKRRMSAPTGGLGVVGGGAGTTNGQGGVTLPPLRGVAGVQ